MKLLIDRRGSAESCEDGRNGGSSDRTPSHDAEGVGELGGVMGAKAGDLS